MPRGRKPSIPHSPFNGLTLDQWQASEPFVAWARGDAMFSNVLAVVSNGLFAIPAEDFKGYRMALSQLLALRTAATTPKPQPRNDYSEPPEGLGALPDEQHAD